jgi:CRP/FNR family transcriptional regulator
VARHLATTAAGPLEPGTRVDLRLTHAQLAARLGTVRELVARALSQLQESGVISRDRSRVIIRDPIRLAALARGDGDGVRDRDV